jgi:hypothetical protein
LKFTAEERVQSKLMSYLRLEVYDVVPCNKKVTEDPELFDIAQMIEHFSR